MPYYIYRVKPFAQLEKLGEYSVFKQASAQAKALRAAEAGVPASEARGKRGARQGEGHVCRQPAAGRRPAVPDPRPRAFGRRLSRPPVRPRRMGMAAM
ncbi:MAG: hypothetical protein KF891_11770 [Rhizobacter sp.]|nr:hypothetical protein [Rhizobacter sp.]